MAQLGCYSQICVHLRCAHSCRLSAHVCTGTGAYAAALSAHRSRRRWAPTGYSGELRPPAHRRASARSARSPSVRRSHTRHWHWHLRLHYTITACALAVRAATTVSASGTVPAAYWHNGRRIAASPARSHWLLEGSRCGGTRATPPRRRQLCQWPLRARPRRADAALTAPLPKGRPMGRPPWPALLVARRRWVARLQPS